MKHFLMCGSLMEETYSRNFFVLSELVFTDVMKIYFSQEFIILNSVKIRFLEIYFKGWLASNKFIKDNCDFLKRLFSKRKFRNLQRVLEFLLNFIYFLFYGR